MKIKDPMYVRNTAGATMIGFGQCMFASFAGMAIPMYLTDVLFLAPAAVSLIFLITRIWNAISDPIIGPVVDRTRTKWGKCRPYILLGAFPLFITTIFLFLPINFVSDSTKFMYVLVIYFLFWTAFALIDVPFGGLKALLYTDPEKRNKGLSFSSTFGSLSSLLAIDLFFILVVLFGGKNEKQGYFLTVLVLSVVGFIALIGGFFTVREVVPIKPEKVPFMQTLKKLLKNKPLLIAIGMQICSLGISAYGIMIPYFSKWNLADSFSFGKFSVESILIPVLSTATGVVFMIAVMITPYLLKFADKRTIFLIMSVLGVVLNLISFFVGYDNLILFIVLRILAHIPPTVTGTIAEYMAMDCLDYGEYHYEERTEGFTVAIKSFVGKVGNAVFSSILMLLLGVVGYQGAVTEPALQIGESMKHNYPDMLGGIFAMMTLLSALGLFLQIIPMLFYGIRDKDLKKMIEELQVRRLAYVETENQGNDTLVEEDEAGLAKNEMLIAQEEEKRHEKR